MIFGDDHIGSLLSGRDASREALHILVHYLVEEQPSFASRAKCCSVKRLCNSKYQQQWQKDRRASGFTTY